MTQEELDQVLKLHKKWLDWDCGGKRAVLRGVDFRCADLSGKNLRCADLRDADLRDADLRGADLRGAELHDAELHDADLRGADLRGAELHDADLRDADLCGAELRGAYLIGANLCDADIDFSVWPLWCGGLNVHIDDRIAIQLLYHLVRNVLFSQNTSEELKSLLSQKEIVTVANQFHRVDECGRIEVTEQCQ